MQGTSGINEIGIHVSLITYIDQAFLMRQNAYYLHYAGFYVFQKDADLAKPYLEFQGRILSEIGCYF